MARSMVWFSEEAPLPTLTPYRLRYWGDPVLKEVAQPVASLDDLPPGLLDAMKRVLREQKGLGLAAQQVGSTARVALMVLDRDQANPVVAINLRILDRAPGEVISVNEGCLSVQGKRGTFRTSVRRSAWVLVEYMDEHGEVRERLLEGLNGTVAQHEADHLDGKCIVDGLPRQQRRQAERMVGKR